MELLGELALEWPEAPCRLPFPNGRQSTASFPPPGPGFCAGQFPRRGVADGTCLSRPELMLSLFPSQIPLLLWLAR